MGEIKILMYGGAVYMCSVDVCELVSNITCVNDSMTQTLTHDTIDVTTKLIIVMETSLCMCLLVRIAGILIVNRTCNPTKLSK